MRLFVRRKDKDAETVTQPRRGGGRKKPSALAHLESEDVSTMSIEVARFWQAPATVPVPASALEPAGGLAKRSEDTLAGKRVVCVARAEAHQKRRAVAARTALATWLLNPTQDVPQFPH